MKKIAVITGGRQDYGLYYYILREMMDSKKLDTKIIATAMHMTSEQNYSYKEIENDGFKISEKLDLKLSGGNPESISESMGVGTIGFGRLFKKIKPDMILVLGDRFEMLSAANAALPFNIPIAHIGGGAITEGAIDNTIRSGLTKFSHLHFANDNIGKNRIISMGEEPWRVKIVGSPRLDFLNNRYDVKYHSKDELEKKIGISFKKKIILMVYHPVTLEFKSTTSQIKNLLSAIEKINEEFDCDIVILNPNLDTSGKKIIEEINEKSKNCKNFKVFKTLDRTTYLSLLKYADVMVGNSSSGIIEGPSFHIPFVNVGNRQKGRDKSINVIDVGYSTDNIYKAIKKALTDKKFLKDVKKMKNPFGDGHSAERIVKILEDIKIDDKLIRKKHVGK